MIVANHSDSLIMPKTMQCPQKLQQDAPSATSIQVFHPQIHEQSSQAHSTLTGGEYSSGLELTEFTRIIKRLIRFIVL